MRIRARTVEDKWIGEVYFVDPLTGSLHVCPLEQRDEMLDRAPGAQLLSRTLFTNWREPHYEASTSGSRPASPSIWASRLSRLPLALAVSTAVGVGKIVARLRTPVGYPCIISNPNGRQQGRDCYARALQNAFELARHRIPLSLAVAVFPPTNTMHAFVLADGRALGEHPDELAHWQVAVLFEA